MSATDDDEEEIKQSRDQEWEREWKQAVRRLPGVFWNIEVRHPRDLSMAFFKMASIMNKLVEDGRSR